MPKGRGSKKPTRKRAPRKPKADAQQSVNGVLVNLVPGDQPGNQKIEVQVLGEVKQTEAPTLLKLAAQTAETQLGIE